MTQVKFIKWHPSVKDIPGFPDFEWNEIKTYEHDDEWLRAINFLITMHFYVGVHWDVDDNLITIAVDNTWFRTR